MAMNFMDGVSFRYGPWALHIIRHLVRISALLAILSVPALAQISPYLMRIAIWTDFWAAPIATRLAQGGRN